MLSKCATCCTACVALLPLATATSMKTCADADESCQEPLPSESVLLQVRSHVAAEEGASRSECKPWCNWIWKSWQGKCTLSSGECSACPECTGDGSPGSVTEAPITSTTTKASNPAAPASDLPFSAMTWNILARQRTTGLKTCHRNPASAQETEDQTRDRYTNAADFLVNDGADVLLLQDAEEKFFGFGPFNPFVQLRKDYGQFSCYNYEVSKMYSSGEYPYGPGPSVMLRRSLMEEHQLYQPFFRCIGSDDTRTGVGRTTRDPFCAILQYRQPFHWTIASCKFSASSFDAQLERLKKEFKVHGKIMIGADLSDMSADAFASKIEGSWLGEKAYIVPEEQAASPNEVNCNDQGEKHGAYFIMDSSVQVPEAATWMAPESPYGEGTPAAVTGSSDSVPVVVGLDKGTGPRY